LGAHEKFFNVVASLRDRGKRHILRDLSATKS
jgi:hypothetical protein